MGTSFWYMLWEVKKCIKYWQGSWARSSYVSQNFTIIKGMRAQEYKIYYNILSDS